MPQALLFERALFVIAPQHAGKSTHLRSMFLDRRLGNGGAVLPQSTRRVPQVFLGHERRLHIRLTSPHELDDGVTKFTDKIRANTKAGRWCFAGALQPDAFKKMPDAVESVKHFIQVFAPERVRIALLSTDKDKYNLEELQPGQSLVQRLQKIPRVEVMCLDGRRRNANGLLLADFFDFT